MAQGGTITKVGAGSSYAQPMPFGTLKVSPEMTSLFYDPFDAAPDTTNRWTLATTGSGSTPSVTTGVCTINILTNASSSASMTSKPTFIGEVPGFCQHSYAIQLEASPITNGYRFWGVGTVAGTPTPTAPMTDGVGFELNTDGKLYAVVWAGGSRTVIQDLSSGGNGAQKLDGSYHRYICIMRTDKTYWYIDSLESPVATSNFQALRFKHCPCYFSLCSVASVPTGNCVITTTGVAVGDTARNSTQLSDGAYPWRQATINSTGELRVDTSRTTASTHVQKVFTASTAAQQISAPGSGLSIFVTGMHGSNSGSTATRIDFAVGSGGTVVFSFFMAASGGGFSVNLEQPWKITTNTLLEIDNSASTSSAYVTISYYIA